MSDKYKYDAVSTSCDPLVKFEKSIKDFDENWALYEKLTQSRETINQLAEALQFYGNPNTWRLYDNDIITDFENDRGQKARDALELAKPWLEGK